jgi:predicted aspartyl protease
VLAIGDAGSRMTVPVTIGSTGPYQFIIDTGAERTVISRELAATLGLSPGREVRLTAMTGTSNVGTVVIPSLTVSSIASKSIEAPALFSANLGAPGMLGIDTLRGHSLSIDFEKNSMTLQASAKRGHEDIRGDDIVIQAKSAYGQLIVTQAFYRGRRISVVIDTGAQVSMGNSALRERMRRELKKAPEQIVLTSVTGQTVHADYTQIERLDIGGVGFNHLPVAFADVAPFRKFGLTKQPALMLGMDALRLFRHVDVDFANREVRFSLPRDALRDHF